MAITGTITWMLKQTAVYWEYITTDQYGKGTFKAPVEIKVRWEDEQEEIVLPDHTKYMTMSHLYTDRTLVLRSNILLGLLSDFNLSLTPQLLRAFPVVKVCETPDVKARKALREAYL